MGGGLLIGTGEYSFKWCESESLVGKGSSWNSVSLNQSSNETRESDKTPFPSSNLNFKPR